MFVTDCVLGAISFFSCRSDPDKSMPIGKIISWLDCMVESKAYLGEYDVEQVLVRWWLCSCYCTCNFFCGAAVHRVGHGLLILQVSRSHTTTHHSR